MRRFAQFFVKIFKGIAYLCHHCDHLQFCNYYIILIQLIPFF